jgi:hypothetical protein
MDCCVADAERRAANDGSAAFAVIRARVTNRDYRPEAAIISRHAYVRLTTLRQAGYVDVRLVPADTYRRSNICHFSSCVDSNLSPSGVHFGTPRAIQLFRLSSRL